jgi:hypothetical protein
MSITRRKFCPPAAIFPADGRTQNQQLVWVVSLASLGAELISCS